MVTRPDDKQTRLTPLHPLFGASVRGLDFSSQHSFDEHTAAQLRHALDQYSLLVFPAANVSTQQQVRFSEMFGPLEVAISGLSEDSVGRHISNLSNVDADGNVVNPDHKSMLSHAANRLWHTDSTFKKTPALASILSAVALPPSGGDTEFASTQAAWQDLTPTMQAKIDKAFAVHDFSHSRAKVSPGLVDEELRSKLPPQLRPLVRTNPTTGRRSIYIASHAKSVEGMEATQALALIDQLLDHCTQQKYVYVHRWQPGDLVMWDNRATLHRGRPWDDSQHARVMYRTTVEDR